jgi:hypothetical protein
MSLSGLSVAHGYQPRSMSGLSRRYGTLMDETKQNLRDYLGITEWLYFEDVVNMKMMHAHWDLYRIDDAGRCVDMLIGMIWVPYTSDLEAEIFEYADDLYE